MRTPAAIVPTHGSVHEWFTALLRGSLPAMWWESTRRSLKALSLCALVSLGACTALAKLDKAPRVSLVNLQPVQIQLLEQRYVATIRIQNPNPAALPIHGLDYAISLNGSAFAEGVSAQPVTIPPYGEKTLELSVTSTIVKLIEQIRRLDEFDGKLTYGITGTLGITGLPGGIEFQRDGEIDLQLRPPPQGKSV